MGDTEISWTHRPGTRGRSWNPIQGCRRVSPGCQHCYAERMASRFAEDGWSKGLINLKTRTWNGEARVAEHKLAEPLSWRDPSTVFVNSMSDLFYEGFTNEQIAAVFGIMALAPLHTFLVLTKRAKRMREWFAWAGRLNLDDLQGLAVGAMKWARDAAKVRRGTTWPLPNVWLGVSVEDQERADERIPELLQTPATVRFISAEPLLGPVDFTLRGSRIKDWDEDWKYDTLGGAEWASPHSDVENGSSASLDWVIAGCESGPGARPCEVAWLRSIRDQCAKAGVAFFLKQAVFATDFVPDPDARPGEMFQTKIVGTVEQLTGSKRKGGGVIERPYLDGKQHIAWPEERP